MTDQEILAGLARHPFLHGLSEAHLKVLSRYAGRITVTPGQFLGREKELANALYLIESGKTAIEIPTHDRGNVRILTIGPGEVVGWSWLVPPHYWQFDAPVIETVQAIALDAQDLRNGCEQDHELGYQLLKRLVKAIAGRLAATRLQLLEVYR